MDAICINSTYDAITMAAFIKNNIKYPKIDEICIITRIHKYTLQGGKIGLFIQGYEGQFITDSKSGNSNEVSFSSHRFTHLNGSVLTNEELRKIKQVIHER